MYKGFPNRATYECDKIVSEWYEAYADDYKDEGMDAAQAAESFASHLETEMPDFIAGRIRSADDRNRDSYLFLESHLGQIDYGFLAKAAMREQYGAKRTLYPGARPASGN